MYDIQRFERIERRRPSRFKNLLRLILFFCLLIFTLNVIANTYLNSKSKENGLFISPVATVKAVIKKTITDINSKENSKSLEEIVLTQLKTNKDNYAVVIKNLDTGERYYLNEHKVFETASLYKLWVMGEVYRQIENGNLSKDQVLSANVEDLNRIFNIASESAERTEGEISWTVQTAIKNMITISDNYSALLLSSKVKISNISQFLKSNGLIESKVGTINDSPLSSASDIALFFEKLYNEELGSKTSTAEMIEYLKNQQINTKLSNLLPEEAVIAHKTGELGAFSHDGGIVFLGKENYIIVVMSETDSQTRANANIAQISKKVYDYFEK
jgi:beta-lactamase class A